MGRHKRKANIFLKCTNGAFVTYEKPPAKTARMLVKVWTPDGEDLIGLSFDSVRVIDSMISALQRCRQEIEPPRAIDPRMRMNSDGKVH